MFTLRIFPFISLWMLLLFASCTPEEKIYSKEEIAKESEKANKFFENSFQTHLDRSPIRQTFLGIKKDYGKWNDISEEFAAEELEITKSELQFLLDSINSEALDHQADISYQLYKENAENAMSDWKWRHHNFPVNQMRSIATQVPALLMNMHKVVDESDAEAYVSRLNGVSTLFDQLIANLKLREEKGVLPPAFVYPRVLESCQNLLKGAPFEKGKPSAILADFDVKVDNLDISESSKKELKSKAIEALMKVVKPSYEKLMAYLQDQQVRVTENNGIWDTPDGDDYYNVRLKRTTTTDLTAQEIHDIGLSEVARIHDEMRGIIKRVSFEGDLQAFFKFLKEDEQFYYPNTDEGRQEYLDRATAVIDNMRSRLDEIFITKPKAEIIVKRVEAFREKSAGKAFYQSAAPDGSRPGTYYANLGNMKNMNKFELESLAYHEGIPGHHMDRSIAQELEGIPKFRKFGGYTAYIEGWGLYSEYIPKEMGLYQDPYSDYGRLAAELWRACRLVVDTGIHFKKWTREEGIEYYTSNTSNSYRDCERMVERHFVMPSQATAYKVGMMKFLELREKAKTALGENFDLRKFHEVVLTSGAVPLTILEKLVDEYILNTKEVTDKEVKV